MRDRGDHRSINGDAIYVSLYVSQFTAKDFRIPLPIITCV
jgi:hypothetical protein